MPAHGIMFHHFHGGDHPASQGSISAEQLYELLRTVSSTRILTAQEWLTRALEQQLREEDVCLTFDDNLRCQYDVALPVLQNLGLTGFWFIYTSPLEGVLERLEIYRAFRSQHFSRIDDFYEAFIAFLEDSSFGSVLRKALRSFETSNYLSDYSIYSRADREFRYLRDKMLGPKNYTIVMDDMIKAWGLSLDTLAKNLWMDAQCLRTLRDQGHIVGLHSHSHPTDLTSLSPSAQRAEYRQNKVCLEKILSEQIITMSHPCNSYTKTTLKLLSTLGIRIGFRATMTEAVHSPLEFPREDHAYVMKRIR